MMPKAMLRAERAARLAAEPEAQARTSLIEKLWFTKNLKKHEAGVSVADLCPKHGASDASICKWKAKFDALEVSEAKRPKTLEDENRRLSVFWPTPCWITRPWDLLGKKW
jgi:putative transposase